MRSKNGRYWMFAFIDCYPNGGMHDFKFSFNNMEEFENKILNITEFMFFQILDTNNNFIFEGDIGTVTKWVCKNIGGEVYDEHI